MTTVRNAVEQQQNARPTTVAHAIALIQPELARALPKHLDADRMARLALTLVRKDRNLAECSPESFAGALLTAAALGLEPGVNGEAYLVAYKRECTLIVGYQGMSKLFFQHPLAQHLDAQTVFENDEFDYAYGLDPFLVHKPALGDRGAVKAYYAVAKLTTGAKAFVVLSPSEVKALRGGNVGPSGRIPDPQRWMERKTCLRQLVKLLPKSTQLNAALAVDERSGRELQADLVARRQIEGPVGVDQSTGEAGPEYQQGQTIRVDAVDDIPQTGGDGPQADPSAPDATSPAPGAGDLVNPRSAQMKALHASMNDAGYGDREKGLSYLTSLLDREIGSTKELTTAEASLVLDDLKGMVEHPFPEPAREES